MLAPAYIVLLGDTTPPRAIAFRVAHISVFGETVPGQPEKGTTIELQNRECYVVRDTMQHIADLLTRKPESAQDEGAGAESRPSERDS
jgi:hypothetical protein